MFVDWFTAGRRASGERWSFDRYRCLYGHPPRGPPDCYESLALRSDDGDLGARLGRFNVIALVALCGPGIRAAADECVAEVMRLPVRSRADRVMAASSIEGEGCVLRIAGISTTDVSQALRTVLRFVPEALGDDPWARKW